MRRDTKDPGGWLKLLLSYDCSFLYLGLAETIVGSILTPTIPLTRK